MYRRNNYFHKSFDKIILRFRIIFFSKISITVFDKIYVAIWINLPLNYNIKKRVKWNGLQIFAQKSNIYETFWNLNSYCCKYYFDSLLKPFNKIFKNECCKKNFDHWSSVLEKNTKLWISFGIKEKEEVTVRRFGCAVWFPMLSNCSEMFVERLNVLIKINKNVYLLRIT